MPVVQKPTMDYKELSNGDALKQLETNEKGITSSEAEKRAKEFGYNEITEKKVSPLIDFLSRFWNPMAWLLEFATVLTLLMGDTFDGLVIFTLLLMNTVIGFYNESSSQKALELLKKRLTIKSRILRDGKWDTHEARELVPGDIIRIELGDVIPADVKILVGEISADQAALTGESLPVNLKESGIAFTGSVVKRGEATCVVVNTGMRTYFGKTVELVNIAKPKSKQEEIMLTICKYIMDMGVVAFLCILLYAISIDAGMVTIMTFAVLFIGGGIPAALPVMFTVAQSFGASELSKKNILVTKLDAMENASSVQLLCLDKTGTMTQNDLEVSDVVPFGDFKKEDVMLFSMLASKQESKDAIDQAVIGYANKTKVVSTGYTQTAFTPFEPATKRTEAKVKYKTKTFTVMKGAPQVIMSLCKLTSKEKETAQSSWDELSKKGCRVLGVAKSAGADKSELEFAGLLALSDPIRPDTAEMISEMIKANIKPMMLTGDSLPVAKEIARQAGIGENIIRMGDIRNLSEAEKIKALENANGLAEIYPEDKFAIVKLFQTAGIMVGMTGDGVNDAPALKQAEMGIAVNNSTDVTKAAASMVLVDPGIKVIIEAVMTSRRIYERMLTWTLNKITKSIQFLSLLTLGFFWFNDIIVSISGLLLLVFVNDFMTMSIATDNARASKRVSTWNVMSITLSCVILGLLYFAQGVAMIIIARDYFQLDFEGIKTVVLLTLVYTSQFRIFVVRERGHFWESWPCREVMATIMVTLIAFTWMSMYGVLLHPLEYNIIAVVFLFSLVFTALLDIPKFYVFKWFKVS